MSAEREFTEALDAYHDALLGCQCTKCGGGDPADAARARVLALYAEIVAERDDLMAIAIGDKVRKPSNPSLADRQGEVYEVVYIQPNCGDPTVPEYAEEWGMGLHGTMPVWLHPGDRVRVTKVEEGR